MDYELVVVGASWGGLDAVSELLERLPDELATPLAVAQHRSPGSRRDDLRSLLQRRTSRPVIEAEDKQPIEPRTVYLAPADYHLLVEPGAFALSTDERVRFARPSIDVLFESAADAYRQRVVGIVLTGANDDGAVGLARVKDAGGVAVVQDPGEAARRTMPDAAIAATQADAVLPLSAMGLFLYGLCCPPADDGA